MVGETRVESFASKAGMRAVVADVKRLGKTIALVPTMGSLHEGHLALVKAASERADFVVVSIFVNPLQFGQGEDFDRYPRSLEADRDQLRALGVDFLFSPSVEEMYGGRFQTTVVPGGVAERWEGERRPGHFEGVATVVMKLFNIVRPDLAFFGEKDFQQIAVVKNLVADLDMGVKVVTVPTVRDADGLAKSSRNAYLTPEERRVALAIPRAIDAARAAVDSGERDMLELVERALTSLRSSGVDPDYVAIVDPVSLEPVDTLAEGATARILVAGAVGTTRLIDNAELVAHA